MTKEAIEDGKKMKDTIHNKVKDMVLQVTVAAFNPTLLRHQCGQATVLQVTVTVFIIVNPILLRHQRPGYC